MSAAIVTYRGCVNAWECDQMGHMNVKFYLDKSTQAMGQLRGMLGLPSVELRHRHRVVMAAHERVLFVREVHAGDIVEIRSGIRGVEDGLIEVSSVMTNVETGEVAARFESALRYLDATDGHVVPWSDEVLARAGEIAAAGVDHPRPRAIEGPRAPESVPEGLLLSLRSMANTWQVNEVGVAPTRFYIGCFSDCVAHVFGALGADHAWFTAHHLGTAALDYNLVFGGPVRLGTAVEIRSGVLELREKVFRMAHYLLEADSGAIAARLEVAGVIFDLKARKSVALPDIIRANADRLGWVR